MSQAPPNLSQKMESRLWLAEASVCLWMSHYARVLALAFVDLAVYTDTLHDECMTRCLR